MAKMPPPPVFGFPFVAGQMLTSSAIDFLTKLWDLATEGVQQPFQGSSPGVPIANQVLGSWLLTGAEVFPAGLSGSIGLASVAATALWIAPLQVTNSQVGTYTIGSAVLQAGGTVFAWQLSQPYVPAAYDILALVAPAVPDATAGGFYFTLLSTLT